MSDRARGAVLLLHGAGGGGWEWNTWARVLDAAGWRAHAPDLQAAAGGLASTTLADYAAQARAALEVLPRPRVVAGASLGGLLALQCAQAADALVLVNPLPPAPWHAELPALAPSPPVIAWRARASLAGTRAALRDAGDGDALYALRRWRDESGAVVDAARAGVAIGLPRLPALVLASGDDTDVPAATSARLAHALGAELIELAGATHVGPLLGRDSAAIAARVVTWLNVKSA